MTSRTSNTKPVGTALTTAQHNVLDALKNRYPDGLSRTELVAQCGHTATTRVGELRRLGWDIPAREQRDGEGLYRLASLIQGHPDATLAGCIIRLGSQVGWTARTHQEAQGGRYSAQVLERAEAAALAAYQAVLARNEVKNQASIGITSTDVDDDDDDFRAEPWYGDIYDEGDEE